MASNDMNSWDEDPDELLRRHWQRVFADFEVRPRSSLSRRILDQLPARHQPKRWLVVLGLLLLSGGLIYQFRPEERPESGGGKTTTVPPATPIQPLSTGRIRQPTVPNVRFTPPGRPVMDSPGGGSVAHRPPTVPGVDSSRVVAPSERPITTRQLPAGQAKRRSGTETGLRANTVPADPAKSEPISLFGTRLPVPASGSAETVGRKRTSSPVGRLVSNNRPPEGAPPLLVIEPPTDALPTVWALLKPLSLAPLPSSLSALPGQLPALGSEATHPTGSAVARRRRHWFVEAVPLSSFQWMSAPPAATAYLSPNNAPAAFSPSTWGYQINGGIRFRRWQAYLSMGQLRRWAYYTVHENRYRVEPSPTNPHHLVRETYAVAENVALPMIGAGLGQQTLLAQGRYVVELGGNVSYLPTSDQALIGLRGGAGRRLPLSRRTELQAGLTVEYGLNRLLNERQHLVIHPLLVGIGIRIQPRSNR